MPAKSILNHVLGPVMRGPSSSHTAGAYHIGLVARSLLGDAPVRATVTFDPSGSYAVCYRRQKADLAFAAALLGRPLTDDRFHEALDAAADAGVTVRFQVAPLAGADHPNTVDLALEAADGRTLTARAKSVGGGAVVVTQLDSWPVCLTGETHAVLVEADPPAAEAVADALAADGALLSPPERQAGDAATLVTARRRARMDADAMTSLRAVAGVRRVWAAEPVYLVQTGEPLFASAAEMVARCEARGETLGEAALAQEAALLDMPAEAVLAEIGRRLAIMAAAVDTGLTDAPPPMHLLDPSAGQVMQAEAEGRLAGGGLHARAAARALAAMHVSAGSGVVCAAPTGGAAGTLPGVLETWRRDRGLDDAGAARALLAAGAVGLVIATRATFAAEVAGCQVEIGAAGAMAAAACVEAAGGSAGQACDAAAIALQNAMGSVCDLVQGICEIPCHTRNAAAAAGAFVCADLVLGGYVNPVPLDETIDAVLAVGKMLPPELRCTALGGLAQTPSALAMQVRDV